MGPRAPVLRDGRQGTLPRPLGRGPALLSYDLAVVGLGIVGASVAYAAAKAGAHVIALDAGDPGAHTSSSSFAWLNANRKEPDAYHRLNAEGMAALRELSRELREASGYHEGGSLEWAEDADKARELHERVARLVRRDYAAELIDHHRAIAMEPALTIPNNVHEVAYYADEAWLDVPRTVRTLLAAATAHGAETRRSTVRELRRQGDRITAVVSQDGDVAANRVVVCVGPATEMFLAPLGISMPVGQVHGLLAVTSAPPEPLTRVVHAPGVHLRPDAGGGLLLGADDLDGDVIRDASPARRGEIAAEMLGRAGRVMPSAHKVEVVEIRVGVRPMPADRHTIAGRVPPLANLWMIATHSGVTLGLLLGRLLAEEMFRGTPSTLLAPFRPARFGG